MSFDFLKGVWPMVVVVGGSLVGYGTLRAQVAELKEKASVAVSDHDRIVRIETQQQAMKDDVSAIKKDVREIARALVERRGREP